MINGKLVLAVIPARGGSKGVHRKNIRELAGKPLIAWTIDEAKKSQYIDRIILSSNDEEIIQVALSLGCEVPFVRPEILAMDDTPGIDPILHAILNIPGYDYIVLLQPTSPLRLAEDMDECIRLCEDQGANACVSVTQPDKSPYWMYAVNDQHKMTPLLKVEEQITRRQELPAVFALNGAVYTAQCDWLMTYRTFLSEETLADVMPKERSLDIDTEFDLRIAEFIIRDQQ